MKKKKVVKVWITPDKVTGTQLLATAVFTGGITPATEVHGIICIGEGWRNDWNSSSGVLVLPRSERLVTRFTL